MPAGAGNRPSGVIPPGGWGTRRPRLPRHPKPPEADHLRGVRPDLVRRPELGIPFDIKQKSQQCLGPYWALIFQRPKVIESQEYNQFIVDSFRTTDKKSIRTYALLFRHSADS